MPENAPIPPQQRFCTGCGVTLTPGVRFCSACGTPMGGGARPTDAKAVTVATPWIVAGVLSVIAVAAVIYAATDRAAPTGSTMAVAAPNGGLAATTDITNMTPRERFQRLSDRVTRASETGDTATVIQFTPMALSAYDLLPPGDRDIDARYHAAMIQAQVGMFAEAAALADTILVESPHDLFGYFVQAIVADFQGAAPKGSAARAAFREQFESQMATKREDYEAHRALLEGFRTSSGPTP